jgi:membrane associated rhomboid family serine protease
MGEVSNFFSRIQGRGSNDPWFRAGSLDVTTSTLIAAVGFVTMFVYTASRTFWARLVLIPSEVLDGQVWRIVTWPFMERPGIWAAIGLLFLWYFGNQVEGLFGTKRFAIFLAYPMVIGSIIGVLLDIFPAYGTFLLSAIVMVVFASEFPGAQFFFGIPARIFIGILIAVQLLSYLADRGFADFLFFVIVLLLTLVTLRAFGMLQDLPQIPVLPLPGATTGPKKAKKPKAKGRGNLKAVPNQPGNSWAPPGAAVSAADEAEMNRLLDRIASNGYDSLSKDERKRLDQLSKQMRKDQ